MKLKNYFFFLCLLFNCSLLYGQQTDYVDSLKNLLLEVSGDAARVNLLVDVAYEYYWNEDYQAALPYADEALALAKKSGSADLEIYAYRMWFDIVYYLSDLRKIEEHLPQFAELVSTSQDTSALQYYYHCKADLYISKSHPDSGLLFYQKAMELNEVLKDEFLNTVYTNNIASIYLTLRLYERARVYLYKSLRIANDLEDASAISFATLNLGYAYLQEARFDSATYYLRLAYQSAVESGFHESVGNALNYQGLLYLKTGDLAAADTALTRARDIFLEHDYVALYGELAPYLARLRLQQGHFEEAIAIATEGNRINNAVSHNEFLILGYKVLADIYQAQGQTAEQLSHLTRYAELQDSTYTDILKQRLTTLEVDYELANTKNALALAQSAEERQALTLKSRTLTLILAMLLLVVVLIIVGNLYKNNRIRARDNERLEQEVEARTAALNERNKQLQEYVEELKNFTYVTSHDLKEPLRNISGFASLLERRLGAQLEGDAKDFMGFIRSSSQQMHTLVEGIRNYTDLSLESVQTGTGEHIDIPELLESVRIMLSGKMQESNASIEFVGTLRSIPGTREVLMLVIKNIVENGIKYNRSAAPKIVLSTSEDNGSYYLSIRDNGIGIAEPYQEQIFQMFKRLHTRQEFEGTGMGLAICRKLVRRLGGEIHLQSEEGKGSTFMIQLPK